ncbi:MAG: ROK family protein [Oscillospiraceae bacterium]|nr:ROK family protein [Oscillospiraceae bacterium]
MYRIGIDLGGTNIAVGVIGDDLKIIGRGKMKTNLPRDPEPIFDDMAKACFMAVENAGLTMDDIASVGIGAPGTINKDTGIIEFSNNFAFEKIPARRMLSERLGGKAVYIDNDANCAALGEAVAGVGNGVKSFVAITLGTGVGSGIVIDGKLVTGINFAAGEMGHTVIMVNGEPCNCGRRGCWESYASATALIRQTKAAMEQNPDSAMWELAGSLDEVNGRTSFDAMRKGDQAAREVVEAYIYYVAAGIINIVNALQPEIVCVGGGIGHEGEALLEPLRKHVERERYSIYASKQTRIEAAVLGNDAGIFGAALLEN